MRTFIRSKTLFILLGIFGITIFFSGVISGVIPMFGQTGAFMSMGTLTIAGILFAPRAWKAACAVFGAFFVALLGGMSVWAHIGGFCLAALCMDFLYTRIVKHHAAVADTILIGLGLYIWLFGSVALQAIGVWLGFFGRPIAGALLLDAVGAGIPMLLIVSTVFIIASNYSKYGSLLRP